MTAQEYTETIWAAIAALRATEELRELQGETLRGERTVENFGAHALRIRVPSGMEDIFRARLEKMVT